VCDIVVHAVYEPRLYALTINNHGQTAGQQPRGLCGRRAWMLDESMPVMSGVMVEHPSARAQTPRSPVD
jgi:hypothetical protein